MSKVLSLLIIVTSLHFFSAYNVSAQQIEHTLLSTSVVELLSTENDDLLFGIDSNWVYLQQSSDALSHSETTYFRARRTYLPVKPGDLEKFSIKAVRDETWSELGDIAHVSIDSDRELAVISAQAYPGALNYDLFIASKKGDGWSKPWALASLNTDADEVFPHFVDDGLYFSSNRIQSAMTMGEGARSDFDIFFASRRLQWQSAMALPFPVNTFHDELSFVSLGKNQMYVGSNRGGGFDVWLISAPTEEVGALGYSMEVLQNGEPVAGIEVKWLDPKTGAPVFEAITDNSGRLNLDELPISRSLEMRLGSDESPVLVGTTIRVFNEEGLLIREYSVKRTGIFSADFLPLDAISDLEVLGLFDISHLPDRSPPLITLHFEVYEAIPTARSLEELNVWWSSFSTTIIELSLLNNLIVEGHTDITGNADSNNSLSELRAVWLVEWLGKQGVNKDKISTKGMGSRFPLIECIENDPCPESTHSANRRVELRWKVD